MTERFSRGVLQANGSLAAEPIFDAGHVAAAVLYMAALPLDANVQFLTITATKMPFIGRGLSQPPACRRERAEVAARSEWILSGSGEYSPALRPQVTCQTPLRSWVSAVAHVRITLPHRASCAVAKASSKSAASSLCVITGEISTPDWINISI